MPSTLQKELHTIGRQRKVEDLYPRSDRSPSRGPLGIRRGQRGGEPRGVNLVGLLVGSGVRRLLTFHVMSPELCRRKEGIEQEQKEEGRTSFAEARARSAAARAFCLPLLETALQKKDLRGKQTAKYKQT